MDRRQFIQTSGAAAAASLLLSSKSASARPMIETDLLIIGSGFAGLWAALTARDNGVRDVTIIDKSSIGRSSQSRMCAGATIYCLPQDDKDLWLKDFAQAQRYFSRQDIIADILDTSYSRLKKLNTWGVNYGRAALSARKRLPSRGFKHVKMNLPPTWKDKRGGAAMVGALLEQVEDSKVKMISRTMITDLLKNQDRVCGAVSVNRLTGETMAIKARAVILAAADCSFRGNYACVDQVTGDGFKLAYDAGVRLNNMEFLCSNTGSPSYGFEGTGVAVRFGAKFLNRNFEPFMKDYHPDGDKAECNYIVQAMDSEVSNGEGPPFYLDMSRSPLRYPLKFGLKKNIGGWVRLNLERLEQEGMNIFNSPQAWGPAIQTLRGGVRTDIDCMSDLPGLFAAGMCQSIDPGLFNGWSTMRAMWSGERSGMAAARFLQSAYDVSPDADEARIAKQRAIACLKKRSGIRPGDVSDRIQQIIFPSKVSIRKSENSLKKALAQIRSIRENEVPALYADDPHELVKAHEAANMALVAELFLIASLERKETRSDHFRVDYQETDNRNWLKWINIKKGKHDKLVLAYEDVPLSSYPNQPEEI